MYYVPVKDGIKALAVRNGKACHGSHGMELYSLKRISPACLICF
jgi:hypothetical protein